MLLSMTGFGEARFQDPALVLSVEVRSVNNRHLKVTVRGSEPYPMLEPELEKIVRKHVRRGTVLVHIRVDRSAQDLDSGLNLTRLRDYVSQVRNCCDQLGFPEGAAAILSQALTLPGVVSDSAKMGRPDDAEWNAVVATVEQALLNMDRMRQDEGQAMANDLLSHREAIANQLRGIRESMVPATVAYRHRLKERMGQILREFNVTVSEDQLLREVAMFAERSDVAEEVVRLDSHLSQFVEIIRNESDGPGRKLEFVTQEMNRETNTIGSKAGDVTISRHVVEIKAVLEKIREMVQNVE